MLLGMSNAAQENSYWILTQSHDYLNVTDGIFRTFSFLFNNQSFPLFS